MKIDSKGMTIIELMLGMVLVSIVALAVTFFISTGTKTCNYAEDTIRVQEEAQIVMNQLVSIAMEGNSVKEETGAGGTVFYVYKTYKGAESPYKEHIFYFHKSSKSLYYYEVTDTTPADERNNIKTEITSSGNIVYGQLMGEYMEEFHVTVEGDSISFEGKYLLNGKEITSSDSIRMRNKIVPVVTPLI